MIQTRVGRPTESAVPRPDRRHGELVGAVAVTGLDELDAGPVPAALVAVTVKV